MSAMCDGVVREAKGAFALSTARSGDGRRASDACWLLELGAQSREVPAGQLGPLLQLVC